MAIRSGVRGVLGGGLDVDGVDPTKKCAGAGYPAVLANVYSSNACPPAEPDARRWDCRYKIYLPEAILFG